MAALVCTGLALLAGVGLGAALIVLERARQERLRASEVLRSARAERERAQAIHAACRPQNLVEVPRGAHPVWGRGPRGYA